MNFGPKYVFNRRKTLRRWQRACW